MKTLEFIRTEGSDKVKVDCSGNEVSVHSHCAYCKHCHGVKVGKRVMEPPQKKALNSLTRGMGMDEDLLNAVVMFNTFVRDGTAIVCDDEEGEGFRSMYK